MSQWLARLERAKQGEWHITDLSVFAGPQLCDGDAAALYEVGLWVRAKEVFMKKLVHVSDSVDLIFEYVTRNQSLNTSTSSGSQMTLRSS